MRDRSVQAAGRRHFLRLCTGAAGALALAPALLRASAPGARGLALHSLHTGERLQVEYWEGAGYVPGALREIDWILRDFRAGETVAIHPRLLDVLFLLQREMGGRGPYQVLSGYRSPATNANLRRADPGVARHSLHTRGMAVDIRLPGCTLTGLRRAALALRAGGVGYYPESDFVHVDVGRVRAW